MNAICLVLDGLHHGYLGCYGNSWIGTEAFDELAAEAFLCDQAYVDTTDLEQLYRSLWCGLHAAEVAAREPATLMHALRAGGVRSTLVTDDPSVAAHPLATDFDERMALDTGLESVPRGETELSRLFSAAIAQGAAMDDPFLLWVHARGLTRTWDAPLELRNRFVEEDEPLPPTSAEVLQQRVGEDFDPDELLGIRRAYAGQVVHLDECLGGFREWLDESGLDASTLLLVIGARGFPLGEHGRIGFCDHALYNELVHVPWLVRYPDGRGAALRTQELVQPADAYDLLASWWQVPPQAGAPASRLSQLVDGETAPRKFACTFGAGRERALRTAMWFLRRGDSPSNPPPAARPADEPLELYVKPDDRWEVNEVSELCPEAVEGLCGFLDEFEQAASAGKLASLGEPSEELRDG